MALDLGADDYVMKPFGIKELLARMRVALRHRGLSSTEQRLLSVGDLVLDVSGDETNCISRRNRQLRDSRRLVGGIRRRRRCHIL